ncbi:methyltransferase domain-containing protein [Corynebacterium sp. MSK044]|uniref:class I SAM-dependent methyltransferase n=1 Tax=Corynebacterium TaxID=1716 RepID=UPI00051023EF|nr:MULTISPECIES: class I SAM-dependent methyltransferase [Corynebacterium]KGF24181.1 methyltransferase [Corynebacterium tuscaniense DNF00037]MDK8794626.1 methyltransferase domain-containing protein [Corynebacterium sp. MSK041]MDK8796590.1 methyltransferase domain-containing protein [Corynebacterium sp. MSK044]
MGTNGSQPPLPQSDRSTNVAAGHWVLARAGKRVLRPGGLKLTNRLLDAAELQDKRVVEFAPGLGRTATIMLERDIASYVGVDQDVDAVTRAQSVVGSRGTVVNASAESTGLERGSAQVVVGEAMLTMQGEKGKRAIIAEAFRLLEPGGLYAIHELGLTPDTIDAELADQLRKRLAKTIRVNARPLTRREWCGLLEESGFDIEWVGTEPMALLSMRRNLADEGFGGVFRILRNVVRDRDLRHRVLEMRRTFNEYRDNLTGIAIIARKPDGSV